MTNLIKLSATPTDQYDWNSIEDHTARTASRSAVENYITQHQALREQADKLIQANTLAAAKCVYILKESLNHGQFLDVCEKTLKLNSNKAGALVTVQHAVMQGTLPADALSLLDKMEPVAARRFLNSDEETKFNFVVDFEQTGKVPSQRDFAPNSKSALSSDEETKFNFVVDFEQTGKVPSQRDFAPNSKSATVAEYAPNSTPSKPVIDYNQEAPKPVLEPTANKWEAKERLVSNKIRLVDCCSAMAEMLSCINQTNKEDTVEALKLLEVEVTRLLTIT